MSKKIIDYLKRGYIILIVALIVLVKFMFLPQQTPTQAAVTKPILSNKQAVGNQCITSGPSGGAYTVSTCITSPGEGAIVRGDQTVSVTATVLGNGGSISNVVFYLNGQYLITDFQSPFTFVLPTNKWVDGSQVLSVAATMKDGFVSQPSSITLIFRNGVTTQPVNHNTFTPTSGTSPQPGQPFVLAAAGDGADGAIDAGKVTNMIASWNPNLFLYLGDVYESGSFTEFYNWYGDTNTFFGRFRSITDPVVGNHEYLQEKASGYFDYWNNIPSYYSFDAAGWHFIALNSNCGVLKICEAGQAEYQWLQNDLNTHSNICTIAYYHHPVYNIGQEGYTTAMNAMWALMAQHGVDIVLNGHEHDYQRWVPLDGNGVPNPAGITEFIAGGGGHGTTPFITKDNRMAIGFTDSPNTLGALRLQLNQYSADFQYINYAGKVLDSGVVPCSGAPAGSNSPGSQAEKGSPNQTTLFSDGFDSGSLSSWTNVTNLIAQQQDVHSGSYAVQATSSGSAGSYATKTLNTAQNNLYYDLWFKIVSQGNTSTYLQNFRTSTNGAIAGILVTNSGKLAYHNNAISPSTAITSTTTVTQNVWHELQTHLNINGTSSQIEVWFDGAKITSLSRTDNFGTDPIGRIYLGDNQPTHIYNVVFDDVAINSNFIDTNGTLAAIERRANTPTIDNTPISFPTDAPTPAPGPSPSPGKTSIQHVFVVMMENHGYDQVWNTSSSPYITSLGNSFARATNYHASIHPSLPNYLQLYGGDNFGITTDCNPSASCHVNATNLADNLEAKGLTWKAYMESMPTPCYLTTSGDYAPKHNPFVYFDDIRSNGARCASHDVPYTALASDLSSASTTPNFVFITPNLCNDMHNCPVSTGDTWLSNNMPAILNSPACTVDKCLLVITWDEDDNGPTNQVLTIFAGSAAKTGGATSDVSYTHYSLLRTIENIFGLPTQTANDAAAIPMTDLLR